MSTTVYTRFPSFGLILRPLCFHLPPECQQGMIPVCVALCMVFAGSCRITMQFSRMFAQWSFTRKGIAAQFLCPTNPVGVTCFLSLQVYGGETKPGSFAAKLNCAQKAILVPHRCKACWWDLVSCCCRRKQIQIIQKDKSSWAKWNCPEKACFGSNGYLGHTTRILICMYGTKNSTCAQSSSFCGPKNCKNKICH